MEKIMEIAYENDDKVLYNNAAQSWNHDLFYCKSMKPKGGLADYNIIIPFSRALGLGLFRIS
jgi:superoxide dismutase